jgi:predicted phage terminase large subunit-like protein
MLKTASPASMAHVLTKGSYLTPKHVNRINAKLLDIFAGRINRLIITMPPRHGKSELVSKYFPVFWLGHRPDDWFVLTSYQADFAGEWGNKAKELFSIIGKDYFNKTTKTRSGSAYRWYVKNYSGGMKSTGVGGPLTGSGADLLLIDDPIKNDSEAMSLTYRNKIWDWFRATAYTRLSSKGAIVIMMTRWHHDDLVGRLLDSDEFGNWELLSLPAIAGENDPLGRMPGEALWPEKFDIDKLNDIKNVLGPFWFSALYQQEPIASEYQIFKTEWWQFYDEIDLSNFEFIVQTWDTAHKEKQTNDFSVCATWGIKNKSAYLINILNKRLSFPDLEKMAVTQYNIFKPRIILIEDASSGQDLIPTLKQYTRLPIKAVAPVNKIIRAHRVTPLIEKGKIYLPKFASWLPEFINQHSQFPNAKHDDIVDTTTMTLEFLTNFLIDQSTVNSVSRLKIEKRTNRSSKFNF